MKCILLTAMNGISYFFLNLLEKAYYDDNDNDKLYNL